MTKRLTMIRPFISDARLGDGFRTAFILREHGETVTLYVPSELAAVTVPKAAITRAAEITYRPRVVRTNIIRRARLYRRHGHRFPREATVALLRLLGAKPSLVEETVATAPLPETTQARERRKAQAEQAAELAAAAASIRDKIEFHLANPTMPPLPPRRPRLRHVHPDQLALAL